MFAPFSSRIDQIWSVMSIKSLDSLSTNRKQGDKAKASPLNCWDRSTYSYSSCTLSSCDVVCVDDVPRQSDPLFYREKELIVSDLICKHTIMFLQNYISTHKADHIYTLTLRPKNICTFGLLQINFDHSSYSKKLWKCRSNYHIHKIYVMVKHVIAKNTKYFKIFLNKTNGQTWRAKIKRYKYFGTEGVLIYNRKWYAWQKEIKNKVY
jgi:hypothetical protein